MALAGLPRIAAIIAAGLPLAACDTYGGHVPPLPAQPVATGTPPASVTIVLPDEIYKTMPSSGPNAHTATEPQLGRVEDYALRLPPGARAALDSRVSDCRFTAHQSCIIVAVSASGP